MEKQGGKCRHGWAVITQPTLGLRCSGVCFRNRGAAHLGLADQDAAVLRFFLAFPHKPVGIARRTENGIRLDKPTYQPGDSDAVAFMHGMEIFSRRQLPVFDAAKEGFRLQDSVVRISEKPRRRKRVVGMTRHTARNGRRRGVRIR